MNTGRVITEAEDFRAFCAELESADRIALDTEFVPEYAYRPMLCLLQVATPTILAAVDAMTIEDLTPFWEVLVQPGREVVAHAGREETIENGRFLDGIQRLDKAVQNADIDDEALERFRRREPMLQGLDPPDGRSFATDPSRPSGDTLHNFWFGVHLRIVQQRRPNACEQSSQRSHRVAMPRSVLLI